MTDRILLTRIAVYAYHGLHPEEEKLGQRFYVSVEARLDLRPAGVSDDWRRTVSYDRLAKIVVDVATERRFSLIEALAEAIAQQVLATYAQVESLVVRVEKPAAPIPIILDGVAIEIERHRDG
ncbi:dihydroneopterin aldolase [Siculibacillus lacustris]|uniref:7,8-dihydroneopterin aldolase n=1 Tax=Siculibacillus lacustris TaxID=1549641 RepID=A0A4Q9VPA1_9HYPH|nr:dihydroneopterin aldolase [Siculibacillus lacustris]TBW37416.1 dihydroneopterin aldolase [Siculibacillus lacustris]